ncbi:type II CAAX prenyl endopeptidase Rce1 family protein [Micrococcus luteus]|uniref:CPBP family glutamic-type intramembrane protease n=1 Tax=Micrococcus luteus TaxID=1270 RepID=UPI00068A42F7|nr:CPBP family glutamic-type intramembrane protease [Micrococcus luteus]
MIKEYATHEGVTGYPALLRTPRARWWNPLASFGLVLAGLVGLLVLGGVLGALALLATSGPGLLDAADPTDVTDLDLYSAPMVLLNNLLLAALIGVALLAVALGHPVAARFVHSVEGRVRWRWLARCVVVLTPLFLAYVLGTWALDGAPTAPRAQDWVWLLVMAFVLTPFQAAGEEYLFRGWLLLAVGTWIRRPVVAVAVTAALSAAAFSLAHGSLDPWILLDLAAFAVAAVLLTWRTGGLEAAVALHVVNNVVIIAVGTLVGTVEDSYVGAETAGSPAATLLSVAVVAVATALLLWQARRAGIARTVPVTVGARP